MRRSNIQRMGFFSRRKAGYKAAVQVEHFRAASEDLRDNDPDLFRQILQQAAGSEADAAAERDPVAYVALFLSAAEDSGVIGSDA